MAIVLLGIVTVPTCSSLITAFRVNVKCEQLLQEQLAVSSAVETLMAEGITEESSNYGVTTEDDEVTDRFPGVTIATVKDGYHYNVTVVSGDFAVNNATELIEKGGVTVKTCIRPAPAAPAETPDVTEPSEGGATE